MKFKIKRTFAIQVSRDRVKTYRPRTYSVPAEMSKEHATRAAQQRAGSWIEEKKTPENKALGAAPEDKAGVVRKTKRRSGTRSKPDA